MILVDAFGKLQSGLGKARLPGIGKSRCGTGVSLSAPPRTRCSVPRVAPVRNEHRQVVRCKCEAECFLVPIRISSLHPLGGEFRFPCCPMGSLDGRDVGGCINLLHRMSAKAPRNFWVARNKVFLAVSSVVFKISPTVRNFSP